MRYLGALLAILVGVPILRYSYATTWRPGLSLSEWLIFIGLLIVTVHAVIATHEIGHVIGGRAVGYRLRLLIIGPLRITRENDGLRVGLNRNLLEYAGLAASAPSAGTTPGRQTRRHEAIIHGAGPAISLFAGAIALALLFGDVPDALIRGRFAEFMATRALALFAAGSLAVGIITLLPGGTRARPTDGSRILEILQAGPEAEPPAATRS